MIGVLVSQIDAVVVRDQDHFGVAGKHLFDVKNCPSEQSINRHNQHRRAVLNLRNRSMLQFARGVTCGADADTSFSISALSSASG